MSNQGGEKMNKIVRFLTISDIFLLGGFGFITPIFAVYITDQIPGGSLEVVGLAVGIFLITKSALQIPFGYLIDKINGEKDDFYFLFFGSIIFSLIPILYFFCDTPNKLYLVQLLYGLASAATLPCWLAIFTRHIDHDQVGKEWATYETFAGLSAAVTASFGGIIAQIFGFKLLFLIVSAFCLTGSFFLLGVYKKMKAT